MRATLTLACKPPRLSTRCDVRVSASVASSSSSAANAMSLSCFSCASMCAYALAHQGEDAAKNDNSAVMKLKVHWEKEHSHVA